MVADQDVSVVCPHCLETGTTVVLRRQEALLVVECHACLSLRVMRAWEIRLHEAPPEDSLTGSFEYPTH